MGAVTIRGNKITIEVHDAVPDVPDTQAGSTIDPTEPTSTVEPVDPIEPVDPPTVEPQPIRQLRKVGPVNVSYDGEEISGLHITAVGQAGVRVDGYMDVKIRGNQIDHKKGYGIHATDSPSLRMDANSVTRVDPPEGILLHTETNVQIEGSDGVGMRHIRTQYGSSGIVMLNCQDLDIAFHQSMNTRGLFDKDGDKIGMGIGLKLRRCGRFNYADFSHFNERNVDSTSDNISVLACTGGAISRGIIDGNNDPAGVGVQIEQSPTGVFDVTDVDAIHMGNGAFYAYSGTHNVTWTNCRTRDMSLKDWGRGIPRSAGKNKQTGERPGHAPLCWGSGLGPNNNIRIVRGVYFNVDTTDGRIQPTEPNLTWNTNWFAQRDLREEDFTPRAPYIFKPAWSE